MNEMIDKIAGGLQISSYTISGSLFVGDLLSILDAHAAAFGVFLGTLTYLTNVYFQWLKYQLSKNKTINQMRRHDD